MAAFVSVGVIRILLIAGNEIRESGEGLVGVFAGGGEGELIQTAVDLGWDLEGILVVRF